MFILFYVPNVNYETSKLKTESMKDPSDLSNLAIPN